MLDKVHIAITCTQRGWYDNTLGKKSPQDIERVNYKTVFLIEWLQNALSNIKPEDKKEDIIFAKEIYKQALTQHDHYLDKRGPLSGEHRTFTIPFNKKLRKKKKYKKVTEKKVKKHQNLLPLFEYNKGTAPNVRHLQWNFMAVCAGNPKSSWRSPVYDVKLFCR